MKNDLYIIENIFISLGCVFIGVFLNSYLLMIGLWLILNPFYYILNQINESIKNGKH